MRNVNRPVLTMLFAFVAMVALCPLHAAQVRDVRVSASDNGTRAVFDLSGSVDYKLFQLSSPDRIVLDFSDSRATQRLDATTGDGLIRDFRTGRHGKDGLRVVMDLKGKAMPSSFLLKPDDAHGYRLVVDLHAGASVAKTAADNAPGPDSVPLTGDRKVVVAIDAGHGGKDVGAEGPDGLYEKTATLAIAKRLAALVDKQPGMKALLTRTGDYYVPLEKRFEIAREHQADLFVSIHANSCPDHCDARGASVWVLSTHGKESEAGRWLARSENAADLIGGSNHVKLDDKSHTLAAVLLDLSQGASMKASKEVGHNVLDALKGIIPLYKDHVQHANFVVLRSPDVPSILVETAFISNRRDERLLQSRHYRGRMAEAILKGVKRYFEATPPLGTWFAAQRAKKLGIKLATTSASTHPSGKSEDADVQDLHHVNSGETLSGIAQQYGVSIDAIKDANHMHSDILRAGSMLEIPTS